MTVPAEVSVDDRVSELEQWRRSYRKHRARRSAGIATASTVVFLVVVAVAVVTSPGWDRVQQSFLNWGVAKDTFPDVLRGMWLNLRVLAISAVLILVVGLAVAAMRTLRGPVFFPIRALATVYVDLFRGIPLIILLYLIGFGLPGLRLQGVPTSPVILGTVALVLTYSAYVAEVFRAGIESVHPSQRAAARSLGLTYRQTMRHVVLPQAVRRVAPPLLNDLVAMQKDVGLISLAGPIDAIRAAQIQTAESYNFTPYVLAGALFVLLAIPTARFADWVSLRATRRQQAGGSL
jgi:polar amino acid transport system permease protein